MNGALSARKQDEECNSSFAKEIAVQIYGRMHMLRPSRRHRIEASQIEKKASIVPRSPQDEREFQAGFSASFSKLLIRLEQKNMLWMMDIISKFAAPSGLVVDSCAGTFSVAKASMFLAQHRRFVGCDSDSKCIALSLSHLALGLVWQVLNKESAIIEDKDVQQAALKFL